MMMGTKPEYAVFILRSGAWVMHWDQLYYGTAKRESDWLNDAGATAKVFVRTSKGSK